jgi:2'-5' RNA ligase
MKKHRCFIAFNLPKEFITEIKRLQELIREKKFFTGKFTEPENIHLTMKFLGEIDEKKIPEVKKKLESIKMKRFDMRLGELGIFSKRMIRILWIKLEGADVLKLQKEIDMALEGMFEEEERFMSHITIARIKHVNNKREFLDYLANTIPKKFSGMAESFSLMESELMPDGPKYTELGRYNLEI